MMAVASELVANRGTAWTLTQDALVSFLKQGTHQDARPAAPGGEEGAKSLPPCLEVQPSAGEGTGEKS